MLYGFLADAVLVVHGLFVLFVALGAALVIWRPRLAWLHLPALAWGAGIMLVGGICPLTPLENALRQAGGQQGYEGGFIEHYLVSALYPEGVTRRFQVGLGLLAVAWNALLYGIAWRRRARRA
ncbi:DUF2784 domain-containing protein [Orrella sp. JC864]|uniref:DUF2784 domain-containing protein n=1 Tax=Orrella sp. JC864 TaxID=3120298 RepID=UPI0012BD47C1